jgi:ribonuclease D
MAEKITVCVNDLPAGLEFAGGVVALDTETDGLDVTKVKLWLVQVADSQGNVWLVQFDGQNDGNYYAAPNLRAILENPRLTKLFHYARFDVAMLQRCLGVADIGPIGCTKIAGKLAWPAWPKVNLRALVAHYMKIELDKTEQQSDWSVRPLSPAQVRYAASDVLYLAAIWHKLTADVAAAGLTHALQQALAFLPTRIELDLRGLPEGDLLGHA